jgi:hypothetical protein
LQEIRVALYGPDSFATRKVVQVMVNYVFSIQRMRKREAYGKIELGYGIARSEDEVEEQPSQHKPGEGVVLDNSRSIYVPGHDTWILKVILRRSVLMSI